MRDYEWEYSRQDKACPVPLNQPTCSAILHAYWRPCFSILSHTRKPSLPRQLPCRRQPVENSDLNVFLVNIEGKKTDETLQIAASDQVINCLLMTLLFLLKMK